MVTSQIRLSRRVQGFRCPSFKTVWNGNLAHSLSNMRTNGSSNGCQHRQSYLRLLKNIPTCVRIKGTRRIKEAAGPTSQTIRLPSEPRHGNQLNKAMQAVWIQHYHAPSAMLGRVFPSGQNIKRSTTNSRYLIGRSEDMYPSCVVSCRARRAVVIVLPGECQLDPARTR